MIQNYKVGLVFSRCGLTQFQLDELATRLGDASRMVVSLTVFAPGFSRNLEIARETVDPGILHVTKRIHTDLEVGAFASDICAVAVYGWLQQCDEIWCMPAKNQVRTRRSRPWDVYRLAEADGRRPKLINHWASQSAGLAVDIGRKD